MSYDPRDVVITHALRTPIGKFLGSLAHMSAADLGVHAARAVLAQAGFPERTAPDIAIFGCARQAGAGPNVARQIAVRSGLPVQVPAFTVNMACASGLKAVALATQAIALEEAEIVLCGGAESMSRVPHLLMGARQGYRLGSQDVLDAMYKDGLHCPLADMIMAETVERCAVEGKPPAAGPEWRKRCDEYAAATQQKAEAARKAGRFKDEIAPVALPGGKKGAPPQELAHDEHGRDGVSAESLAKLPALYPAKDEAGAAVHGGVITAGNASGITDGAAALLVMRASKAQALGLEPLAKVGFVATSGVEPARMGIGPIPAVRTLLARTGRTVADYDLYEMNEAFAAQVLLCNDELGIDPSRINVNGGAIALGHPIGCTGARIVVTLAHEMKRRAARRGIAALCVSGGMGMAMELIRE